MLSLVTAQICLDPKSILAKSAGFLRFFHLKCIFKLFYSRNFFSTFTQNFQKTARHPAFAAHEADMKKGSGAPFSKNR